MTDGCEPPYRCWKLNVDTLVIWQLNHLSHTLVIFLTYHTLSCIIFYFIIHIKLFLRSLQIWEQESWGVIILSTDSPHFQLKTIHCILFYMVTPYSFYVMLFVCMFWGLMILVLDNVPFSGPWELLYRGKIMSITENLANYPGPVQPWILKENWKLLHN